MAHALNRDITSPIVYLDDKLIPLAHALAMAGEQDVDLIDTGRCLVLDEQTFPTVVLMDYGKWKYLQRRGGSETEFAPA